MLGFRPQYVVYGSYTADPIARIILTARSTVTNTAIAADTFDVRDDAQWNLSFSVPADAGTITILVELLNAGGVVQYSGVTPPITVQAGQNNDPAPVPLVPGPPDNLTVTGVIVAPHNPNVVEGDAVQLTAAISGGGPGARPVWSSSDAPVASVDQNGLVTTHRNGTVRIIGQVGMRADTAVITIAQRASAIVLTPDTQRIGTIGGEATFTARVVDPRGADIAGSAVTWSVGSSAIAENMNGGRVRAVANGTTTIVATSIVNPAIQRTGVIVVSQRAARVVVSPALATANAIGAKQTFTAAVQDANGTAMSQAITWRSANAQIATIDANGVATATGLGSVDIRAVVGAGTPDSVSGRATFQVTQSVRSIEVTPSGLVLESVGDTARMTATARDANNIPIPNLRFVWSSTNGAAAQVDSTGLVRANGDGSTQILAELAGVRASAPLTVQQKARRIDIAPAAATISAIGQSLQLTATAFDRRGNAMSGARLTWSSSNPTVATVDSTGKVVAVTNGSASIRAAAQDTFGVATITVSQLTPTAIVIQHGNNQTGVVGAALPDTLVVKVTNANNGPFVGAVVRWVAVNGGGTVSPDSIVTDASGLARARWTLGTVAGAAQTVEARVAGVTAAVFNASAQAGATARVTIAGPDSVVLHSVGDTLRFNAAAFDQFNNATGATPTWSSLDTVVATVDAAGKVTARANGRARIVASVNPSDTVIVIVQQTVSSVLIAPRGGLINAVGGTLQLSLTARDARGVAVPGARGAWTSSNPAALTVDSTGLVRAPALGSAWITVTSGSARDSVQVVARQQAAHVTLGAAVDTVQFGDSVAITVVVSDSNNVELPGSFVFWTSSNPAVAVVSPVSNNIVGVGVGTALLIARADTTVNAPADTVQVVVVAPDLVVTRITVSRDTIVQGDSVVISATVKNIGNARATASQTLFSILAGDTVTVIPNGAQLLATPALQPGDIVTHTQTLHVGTDLAWSDSVRLSALANASSTVRESNLLNNRLVTGAHKFRFDVAQLVIAQHQINLSALGDSAVITATPKDQFGRTLAGYHVSMRIANAPVCEIDCSIIHLDTLTGVVTARRTGNVTIIVTASSITDSVHVSVQQQPTSIEVGVDTVISVLVGDTLRLVAAVRDARGALISNANVVWASTEPAAIRVDQTGKVTADEPTVLGLVIASINGLADTARIRVQGVNGVTRIWRGLSSNWGDPNNWSSTLLPTANDTVLIPVGTPFQPQLDNARVVGGLDLAASAQIDLQSFTLSIAGRLNADGQFIRTTGGLELSGAGNVRSAFAFPPLTVTGNRVLIANARSVGDVTVSGGVLDLGGRTLVTDGAFNTAGSGIVNMTTPGDSLFVTGNAQFNCGNTVGRLTQGVFVLQGNLTVTSCTIEAFAPSNNFTTILRGNAAQTLFTFHSDTSAARQHFQHLIVENPNGVTLESDIAVNGNLRFAPGAGGITGVGRSATLLGDLLDASGGARWAVSTTRLGRTGQAIPSALTTNLVFLKSQSLVAPLTLTGDFTINAIELTQAGKKLTVNGNVFTQGGGIIAMTNAADSLIINGDAQFNCGNTVNRLTDGVMIVKRNFTVTSCTIEAFAASGNHRVVLRDAAAQTLSTFHSDTMSVRQHFQFLDIDNPAGVNLVSDLAINGKITLTSGTLNGIGHSATLLGDLAGTAAQWQVSTTRLGRAGILLPSSLTTSLVYLKSGSLTGSLTLTGNFSVDGVELALAGKRLVVNGDFSTNGSGVLNMTNAADTLRVTGNTTLNCGNTVNKLTNGVMILEGNFAVTSCTIEAFSASGSHKVRFAGSAAQSVTTFHADSTSVRQHFQNLELANLSAAGVQFNSNIYVNKDMTSVADAYLSVGAGQVVSVMGNLAFGNDTRLTNDGTLRYRGALSGNLIVVRGPAPAAF